MNKFLTFLLLAMLSFSTISAQDQQFSQFFAAPMTLNPALTGAFSGRYRVGIIYRNQWANVLESPMVTYGAAADFRFSLNPRTSRKQDGLGAGMIFYADRFSDSGFSTNQLAVSTALHKSLSDYNDQYLTLGVQLGIAQRNINFGNIFFNDQFNGTTGFTDPTAEPLPANNFTFSDLSVGLNYTYAPQNGLRIFAGAALFHVVEPEVTFYQDTEDPDEAGSNKLFRKLTSYLSVDIALNDNVRISPRAVVHAQGPFLTINAGANLRLRVDEVNGVAFHLGGWIRPVSDVNNTLILDTAVAMAGIEFDNILFGLSYDIGLSSLDMVLPMNRNIFEFSIAYLGLYDDSAVYCPKF